VYTSEPEPGFSAILCNGLPCPDVVLSLKKTPGRSIPLTASSNDATREPRPANATTAPAAAANFSDLLIPGNGVNGMCNLTAEYVRWGVHVWRNGYSTTNKQSID